MKQPKRDITILLTTLLVFSISIGLIHTSKKFNVTTVIDTAGAVEPEKNISKIDDEVLKNYTPEQIIEYINPLVQAESTREIGTFFTRLDNNKIKQVLELLCSKKESNLDPDEIATIIVHLTHESGDAQKMEELFDYAAKSECLQKGLSLLAIAADFNYANVIEALKLWMEKNPENSLVRNALLELVKNNNPTDLAKLLTYNLAVDKAILNEALWQAVDRSASPDFIAIFKQYGADMDYANNNKTVLMRAVELANKNVVRALIEEGAQANLLLDPQVGTALQFALALDNEIPDKTAIELLLRNAGAHE